MFRLNPGLMTAAPTLRRTPPMLGLGGQYGTTWLIQPMICTPGTSMRPLMKLEVYVSLVEEFP